MAISQELQKQIDRIKSNDPTLTSLNLIYENIDDEGAQALADALRVNKTLTSLMLRSNNIGDAGAEKIADALKENNTLISLSLSYNGIGNRGTKALANALKVNKNIISLRGVYNKEVDELVEKNFADAKNNAESIVKILDEDTIDVTDPDTINLLRSYTQRSSAVNKLLTSQHGVETAQKYIKDLQSICDVIPTYEIENSNITEQTQDSCLLM